MKIIQYFLFFKNDHNLYPQKNVLKDKFYVPDKRRVNGEENPKKKHGLQQRLTMLYTLEQNSCSENRTFGETMKNYNAYWRRDF